ncbi:MAG: amidohydrolase [Syntrophomonadaceae bacterium]
MSLLIKNISMIPMTADDLVIEQGYLEVAGDEIRQAAAGEAPEGDYERIIDGTNLVALPGFVNAHTHAAMTLLRGYADDMPLMEWLEKKIWPLEAKLTAEDVYWGTMLAIVEMIRSGTTCFADMYFFMDKAAAAADRTGIRALLSRGLIGVGPDSEKALAESRELIQHWNQSGHDRVRFNLGPHAPYTCPPEYLRQVADLAGELGVGMHIHLAETASEAADSLRTYGLTPVAHMDSLGLFEHPVLAAHCVHLTDEDIGILARKRVGVAHNPESNMKLASGIAPVPKLLEAGVAVALGTDGASSNNNLDMMQEMHSCALLHKVNSMDPTIVPAYQALKMATFHGAQALGLDDKIGTLEPGKKADIILVRVDGPHCIPRYDIVANLVYSGQASDVDTVIIDGRIVMHKRVIRTFDEEEVLEQAKYTAARLMTR